MIGSMNITDATNDPYRTSWIESANEADCDFPLQNLPYCRFRRSGDPPTGRVGVGLGDQVIDLQALSEAGLLPGEYTPAVSACRLNELMGLPVAVRHNLRQRLSQLFDSTHGELRDNAALKASTIVAQQQVELLLPCEIGDYTDFYASVYHATNVGSMFRPDHPLLPNYKHVPIGYHGRGSSVVVSGATVTRPCGQLSPAEEGGTPTFAPSAMLDYELEVGFFVAQGNRLGQPIEIGRAEQHIFGFCLVNDWSARDIQRWEYQPLGPFLAKSFATTISPWVVPIEALAPFRCPAFVREPFDPQPLPYLNSEFNARYGGLDLQLEVFLSSAQMRSKSISPMRLSQASFRDMYWTAAQMLTHHASNGCNLQTGDLIASGTVSGPARQSRGCLLELSWDGEYGRPVPGTQRTPIQLPSGEQRKFLADGDEVVIRGYCHAEGYPRVGLGECRGTVRAAVMGP